MNCNLTFNICYSLDNSWLRVYFQTLSPKSDTNNVVSNSLYSPKIASTSFWRMIKTYPCFGQGIDRTLVIEILHSYRPQWSLSKYFCLPHNCEILQEGSPSATLHNFYKLPIPPQHQQATGLFHYFEGNLSIP